MEAAEYSNKISFYNSLSEQEQKLVNSNVAVKEYKKGEMIHSCSGACLGLIYVISGNIRVSVFSEEGRELTLFKIGPGETCVFSAACVLHEIRLDSSMTAACDTTVLVLNSRTLASLVSNNTQVKCYCYEIALQRFSEALFVLQEIILLGFDKRLAKYLLEESKKAQSLTLKTTQEVIATDVSSAREVVARMLKQFELEGLVELKRGSIEIKDADGLQKII